MIFKNMSYTFNCWIIPCSKKRRNYSVKKNMINKNDNANELKSISTFGENVSGEDYEDDN